MAGMSAAHHFQPQPFAAIIFDMDGTLLDTETVFRDVVQAVSRDMGFSMSRELHLSMVGASHEASNKLLVEAYGVTFPYMQFDAQCRALMKSKMAEAVPVKAGVHEMLEALRERGIPAAVATSSRSPHAIGHLGAAGLLDMFATIVTRDDVTHPKPHPEPYLLAAERLGLAPADCLAVEDSHAGVRSAHAAGMQTVMVPDLLDPNDEIRGLCAAVLTSLHELRKAAFPR